MNSAVNRQLYVANYSGESWESAAANSNETEAQYQPPPFYNFSVISDDFTTAISKTGESGESPITPLPDVFTKVSPGAWPIIYSYAIVFIVAAVGNFIEFISVWRRLRKRSTAMNRLLLHLCIADIVVVFMVAAVEVFWRISIGWYAGDFMCKFFV